MSSAAACDRGRLAPTPSGFLHLGHARTFWLAFERVRAHAGVLVFRNEDLDPQRCREEFAAAALEDLRWLGIEWQEGPDVDGPHAPYIQSRRLGYYAQVWALLHAAGTIYPSPHSRKDVQEALMAPHDEQPATGSKGQGAGNIGGRTSSTENEQVFPTHLRPSPGAGHEAVEPGDVNWRFRVPDGETIAFVDRRCGPIERIAGRDFGDFVVWRKDGFPSYELAVVADDRAMEITEVVRGEDLLTSTARQLLLYRALRWQPPAFYHAPLLVDDTGRRLAKRSNALALRALREAGHSPADVRMMWT